MIIIIIIIIVIILVRFFKLFLFFQQISLPLQKIIPLLLLLSLSLSLSLERYEQFSSSLSLFGEIIFFFFFFFLSQQTLSSLPSERKKRDCPGRETAADDVIMVEEGVLVVSHSPCTITSYAPPLSPHETKSATVFAEEIAPLNRPYRNRCLGSTSSAVEGGPRKERIIPRCGPVQSLRPWTSRPLPPSQPLRLLWE